MKSQRKPHSRSLGARSFVIAAVGAIAMMTGGCATDPYIQNPRPAPGDNPEKQAARAAGLKPGTVEFSLRYLDNTYEAYDAKVIEEHNRQQGLAAALISVTGLAIGAAAGDHTTTARNLALGGATLFTLGNWNTNASRKDIYREGQRALTCAKDATSPLAAGGQRIGRLTRLSREMKTASDVMADAKGAAYDRLMRVAASAGAGSLPSVRNAEAELAAADATAAKARNAAHAAEQLQGKLASAGIMLEGRVDAIRTIVSKALDGTAAALSQLPAALAGIGSSLDIVLPGASSLVKPLVRAEGPQPQRESTQESTTAVVASEQALAEAIGKLVAAREKLESAVARMNGAMSEFSITSDEVRAALKRCGVDVAAAAKPLELSSAAMEFEPGVQKSIEVRALNGTDPIAAQFVAVPAKGLNVKVMGRSVQVTASAEAEPGSRHVVRVSDATGAQVELTVIIREKAAPKQNDAPKTGAAPKFQCFGQQDKTMWNRERVCLLQGLIGTRVDGDFGDNSCAAYITKGSTALDYPKAKDGQVDKDALQRVFAKHGLGTAPSDAQVAAKAKSLGCPDPAAGAKPGVAITPGPAVEPAAPTPAAGAATGFVGCPAGSPNLPGARTPLECTIGKDKLLAIRARLAKFYRPINASLAEFDDKELRVVLAAFQKEKGLPVQNGNLDDDTAAAIDALK